MPGQVSLGKEGAKCVCLCLRQSGERQRRKDRAQRVCDAKQLIRSKNPVAAGDWGRAFCSSLATL